MIDMRREIVINTSAITKAVDEKHGVYIDHPAAVLWPGEYMNDSYKGLCLEDWMEEEAYEEYQHSPDEEELYHKWLIIKTLREELPKVLEYVLVDVSW